MKKLTKTQHVVVNMVGIYKIHSPSGKVYIGQSWNISDRLRKYRNLRCKAQRKLYSSLVKHGFDSHTFEIVQEFPKDVSQDVLNNYELFYWKQYVEAGGSRKHSEETIQKLKERDHSYKVGRKQSPETVERRVSKIRGTKQKHKKGIVFTEEHRKNMSEARKRYFSNKKLQDGR